MQSSPSKAYSQSQRRLIRFSLLPLAAWIVEVDTLPGADTARVVAQVGTYAIMLIHAFLMARFVVEWTRDTSAWRTSTLGLLDATITLGVATVAISAVLLRI